MQNESYARILGAVGRVLDLAGAHSFAVREDENGLLLELIDAQGERISRELSVSDLAEIIDWAQSGSDTPEHLPERRDEGTLSHLLEHGAVVATH